MLPAFKYHPDPLATGAIETSDLRCECCGQARGYIYAGVIYSTHDVKAVCPWCIADGTLALKYDATLSDDHPLLSEGLPRAVVEEVVARTPGFISWQGTSWLSCCGDACEFHGDAGQVEVQSLGDDALQQLSDDSGFSREDLEHIVRAYEPAGSPAIYKFVCRHCSRVKFTADCD